LVEDLLEINESSGVSSDRAPNLNAAGKTACFDCHGKQKDRDLAYSQYRK